MNKYRKGRLLVLTGMLAFSTATVLVGSASADKGTIKVGSSVDGSKGNDPKISGCVDIDTSSYPAGVHVTYTLQPPTGTAELGSAEVGAYTTEHANLWYLIAAWQGNFNQAGPYHISVTVNSDEGQKSKVFWLSDPWTCSPPIGGGGNT